MLPSLWDALGAATHGDVHVSNIVVAPSRNRFALIDPAAMVPGKRGESGASIGASWLTFMTHASAYPVLPPYAAAVVQEGATLRDYADQFVASCTASASAQTLWSPGTPSHLIQAWPPPVEMRVPQQPDGTPLAADWLAVALLYYAALTDHHPFEGRLARPFWHSAAVIQDDSKQLQQLAATLDAPIPPPSTMDARITSAEDELAVALVEMRIRRRADLMELHARATAASR
jgi:hypothetical protein